MTEYQHGTCSIVHPRGSLRNGDIFKALCGIEAVQDTTKAHLPKCAMCVEAFNIFDEGGNCTLCKTRENHI